MDIFELALEREQPLLPGHISQIDDRCDGSLVVMLRGHDGKTQQGDPSQHDRQRILNADSSDGSAHHDDEGGELHNRTDMAAFKDLSADNRPKREDNSKNCCDIQFVLHPVHHEQTQYPSRLSCSSGLSGLFGLSRVFGWTKLTR